MKIISGGQTGADRAALDFAIKRGLEHGGFCPKGRRAENKPIPKKYNLVETESRGYPQRTILNVKGSDGTVIFVSSKLTTGCKLTLDSALQFNKPVMVINLNEEPNYLTIGCWIIERKINVLNIAGSRESTKPGIHKKVFDYLTNLDKCFEILLGGFPECKPPTAA